MPITTPPLLIFGTFFVIYLITLRIGEKNHPWIKWVRWGIGIAFILTILILGLILTRSTF